MGLFNSLFSTFISDDKGCDWYCDNCGAFLNTQSFFTTSSDTWTCTQCGTDNDVSVDNIINDEDDDYYTNEYSDDDIPQCCLACGGPYPQCTTSCNLFDD